MEEDHFRPMDIGHNSERTETKFPNHARTDGCQSNQVWFARAERGGEEGDTGIVSETSCRESTGLPGREGILLHLLHGSQKGRRIPTHTEFEEPQHTPKSPTLQDGDFSFYPAGTERGGLGDYIRPQRRLLSRAYFSKPQEIPEICLPGHTLPVQSITLWDRHSTTHIYENMYRASRILSQPSSSHLHVSRRLDCQESGARNAMRSKGTNLGDVGYGRAYPEQEEVRPSTHTVGILPWSGIRPEVRNNFPIRREIPEHGETDRHHFSIGGMRSPKISETSRLDVLLHGFDPQSPSPDETDPIPSKEMVECGPRCVEEKSADYRRTGSSFKLVEKERQFLQRRTPDTGGRYCPLDRRIGRRLGCSLRRSTDEGGLERDPKEKPHKLVRIKSSASSTNQFSTTSGGEKCTNSYRQLNCSGLHQQGGGHEISSPLSTNVGDFQLGGKSQYKIKSGPHSGKEKCYCGRSVKKSEVPQIDRMVSEQGSCEKDFSNFPDTEHRPVRNPGEQTADSILFPTTNRGSLVHRCLICKLERNVCLCIPPSSSTPSCFTESTTRTVQTNFGGPIHTNAIMVPSTFRTTGRLSKTPTRNTESAVTGEGSLVTSRPTVNETCSMENIRSDRRDQGLSEKVKKYIAECKRPSTRKMYRARQRIYDCWCRERQIDPSSATLNEVAEFLIFLHERKGCKASTLTGYRSAISEIHDGWGSSSIGTDKVLSKLVKGIFHCNPISQKLLPSWDLPLVLEALSKPPFEPLRSVELKYLTWKTVFLIAMASANRISELHALSINQACLRQEPSGIRLIPKFEFLAKNQRMHKAWSPWFIPDFRKGSRNARDLILCPCRCIRTYLERTTYLRGGIEALFITYKVGDIKPASKDSIARWLVSTIKQAYESKGVPFPRDSKAHDTRKLAVSWALMNGASPKEILEAAHWTAESTFTAFYLKDVSSNEGNFARASILGPIKDRKDH